MRVYPHVTLITHTPNPEKVVTAASRLCYSGTNIDTLMERTQEVYQHTNRKEDEQMPSKLDSVPSDNAAKAARHADICNTLNKTYIAKNADYGDSFTETYRKLGIISAVTRISDKTSRLQSLCKREALVKDESLRDTLLDLANYAIMTVMAMDEQKCE